MLDILKFIGETIAAIIDWFLEVIKIKKSKKYSDSI